MTPRIYAYTVTRANSPDRGRLLNTTLTVGRDMADHDFEWHVYVNGEGTLADDLCASALALRVIDSCKVYATNVGQHVPSNEAVKAALDGGYDYLLRIDDDVEWISKRWLAKLVEASQKVGDKMVLSPIVKGLRWQPPQSQTVHVEGIPLKFIEGPIGGICRLTPTKLLREKPYVSDVRLPMGGGDAAGVFKWASTGQPLVYLAYCQHIRIRHAKSTDGQVKDDPLHFKEHDVFQYLPWIPAC